MKLKKIEQSKINNKYNNVKKKMWFKKIQPNKQQQKKFLITLMNQLSE